MPNSWLIIDLSRSSPTFPILIPHPHLLPIAICTVGMAADSKAKWTDRKWHRSTALRATSAVDQFFFSGLRHQNVLYFPYTVTKYVLFSFYIDIGIITGGKKWTKLDPRLRR